MTDYKLFIRKVVFRLFSKIPRPTLAPAATPIDVIIPIIQKDLIALPLCLEGLRNCVQNRIKTIYIIAPQDQEIIEFCRQNSLTYVDELSVLGYGPKQVNLINSVTGANRSGWIFQQLLKLAGNIGDCRYFLCIDADNVLIQPHVFVDDRQRSIFYMSPERHQPYYDNIPRLTKGKVKVKSIFSYIAHKMIFDKEQLEVLKQQISESNQTTWDAAILSSLDLTQDAGFSEFELYGNFHPDQTKCTRAWGNLNLSYEKILSYEELRKKYAMKYKALTFPAWLNN